MTVKERNSYENLLLLCPNHHDLIDELEPERFTVDDLMDMKHAHETGRPGDRDWCTDEMAEQFVAKLVLTLGLVLLPVGAEPREPIRSGTAMPDSVLPEERRRMIEERTRDLQPQRPNWAQTEDRSAEWPKGRRRVRDLAAELGMTQRAVLELCAALGIPTRSKDTGLSEPYANMVRRRARRDGLAQENFPART